MGFLDHLFKPKPNEEKMGEESGDASGAREAAETPPVAEPDPGAFLQPRNFLPRGNAAIFPGHRPPATTGRPVPEVEPRQEIVLTLGDVLSRIPTQVLQTGFHDAKRELRFSIDDLSSDIARGRAAVPLSKIAALCPDIFARPISADEDTEIRLPLQKLVEQIGLLRGRPAMRPDPAWSAPAAPANAAHLEAADKQVALAEFLSQPDPPPAPAAAVESDAAFADALPRPETPLPPPMPPSEESPAAAPPQFPLPPAEPPVAAAASGIRIHPPPAVRPILVAPPAILAAAESAPAAAQSESPVAAVPHPVPEIAPTAPAGRTTFDGLQALFMTEESLDLATISRLVTALPGVRACTIALRDERAFAGDWPEGFDLATLQVTAARLTAAADSLAPPSPGAWQNITLHAGQGVISFFARPDLLLAALHGALPPGVRERLVTVADELARS